MWTPQDSCIHNLYHYRKISSHVYLFIRVKICSSCLLISLFFFFFFPLKIFGNSCDLKNRFVIIFLRGAQKKKNYLDYNFFLVAKGAICLFFLGSPGSCCFSGLLGDGMFPL